MLQLLPPLIVQLNPYHRRNPQNRYTPFCRTELYKNSFFPSTTELWNNLPDSIKLCDSLSSFKRYLRRADVVVPPYFYGGEREAQTVHCRLRLGMSDLNEHLYLRHLTDNCKCACGYDTEDVEHFLIECPLFFHARQTTIMISHAHHSVHDMLHGNPSLSIRQNERLFSIVQAFIVESGRFG